MQEFSKKLPKNLNLEDAQQNLEVLKAKAICIVGEKHVAPIFYDKEDFFIVNANGNADSEKYAKAIASFANIYIKSKFPDLDLTASTVSPIPKKTENSNVAYHCVVVTGNDCKDKKEELTEVADLIRYRITLQYDTTKKESKLDISCLDDAIANFLSKNSLKNINGKFSVGNCYDISRHIPIKVYAPGIKSTDTDSYLEGYAIQNGYNEKDNIIYLLAYDGYNLDYHKSITVKISKSTFISKIINARKEGKLLEYKVGKESDSKFYHLIYLELSDMNISANMSKNQKKDKQDDLELS